MRHESHFVLVGAAFALALGSVAGSGCRTDETEINTGTTTTTTTTTSTGSGGTGGTSAGGTGGTSTGGTGGTSTGGTGGTSAGGTGGTSAGGTSAGGTGGTSAGGTGGTSTGGSGGGLVAGGVYIYGDFETNNQNQAALFTYPGPTRSILSITGLDGGASIDDLAVSPDGSIIAVGGRNANPGARLLAVYPADGSGSPVVIDDASTFTNTAAVFTSLAISPDGQWLAYAVDSEVATSSRLFVAPTDGSLSPRALSPLPQFANSDVFHVAWAGDSQHVAYVGDVAADTVNGAYVIDALDALATPTPLVPEAQLNAAQSVSGAGLGVAFDASNRIYFKSDYEVDNLFRLYRTALDGSGLVQVPGSALQDNVPAEAAIGAWGISRDGTQVAFAAATFVQGGQSLEQIYVLGLSGGTANVVSNVLAAPIGAFSGASFSIPIAWIPDGTKLAVAADWATDNDYDLFVLPTTGTGGVRITSTAAAGGDILAVAFGNDGQHLYTVADLLTNNEQELYATADFSTADQAPANLLIEDAPNQGDVAAALALQQ